MSDITVRVGAVDNATPTLKKVRGEADKLGQSLRRAAEASGKIGGAVGGVGGRVLGGFGMGGGIGMVAGGAALAVTALTTVMRAVSANSERQVQIAQQGLRIQQQTADIQRNAQRAREAVAAGGLAFVRQARQASAVGGQAQARRLMAEGVEMSDALQAGIAMQTTPGAANISTQDVAQLARTGFLTASEAVSELSTGQSPRAILTRRLGGNRQLAEQALERTAGGFRELRNIEQAVIAGNDVQRTQYNDLVQGRTTPAVARQQADVLDGGASRAIDEMRRQIQQTAEMLSAAAAAQSGLGKLMNELGGLVSQNSRTQQAADFQRGARITQE